MARADSELSAKQREILRRERSILVAAERILVADGFLDMSMARIAQKSKCPRGTIYHHFTSREDIVVTLASRAWEKRLEMMRRGASCSGPTRVQLAGIGEGIALFFVLYPEQFSLLHKATETVCERASPLRLDNLRRAERATADIVRDLIHKAVRDGDLRAAEFSVEEIAFGYSALITGGFALQQTGYVEAGLGNLPVMENLRKTLNLLGDAYGWRPLTKDVDWDQTAAEIRRTMFPEEVQQVFGPEAWDAPWNSRIGQVPRT